MRLGVNWCLGNSTSGESIALCTDSRSVLQALSHHGVLEGQALTDLREELEALTCNRTVTLQWVPGHCGVIGNEWADHEANRAAGRGEPDEHEDQAIVALGRNELEVSWSAARCRLRQFTLDRRVTHNRVRRVYGVTRGDAEFLRDEPLGQWCAKRWLEELQENDPAGVLYPPLPQRSTDGSRREMVLLAQLRTGHCRHMAAYARIVNQLASPICPHCGEEPEEVEHWLQRCPAWLVARHNIFGAQPPPLSVLARAPTEVSLYARRTLGSAVTGRP